MRYLTTVLLTVVAMSAHGASYTVDENGIDALSTGLNGDGIEIGQVEPGRPGMKDYDTNPNLYTTNAIPKRVYEDGNPAAINNLLTITHGDHHANKVAGIMIGTDDPFPIYRGAAPAANLYANTIGSGMLLGQVCQLRTSPVRPHYCSSM